MISNKDLSIVLDFSITGLIILFLTLIFVELIKYGISNLQLFFNKKMMSFKYIVVFII